jgi:hypothetical protein
MITKKEFFLYMSELYEEPYTDSDSYRAYKEIVNCTDKSKLKDLVTDLKTNILLNLISK